MSARVSRLFSRGVNPVAEETRRLNLEVIDAESYKPLFCRVYIRGDFGKWYLPKSPTPRGTVVEYRK